MPLHDVAGTLNALMIYGHTLGQEADRTSGLDAGFDVYFVKPVELAVMLESVARSGD